ncbi:O12 family O-antigen flippase [Plesiomonas shigelloides]|nr:O12 family O-antigen flippase [Plesiomonas shigelloides]
MYMSSTVRNGLSLLVMQGVNYLIPLMTLPYLTRVLGAYQYGVVNTVLSFGAYAILVIDFGFNLTATKDVSIANSRGDIEKIFSRVLISKTILFFISFLLVFLFVNLISNYDGIEYLIYFLIPQLLGSVFFPVWLFQGIGKVHFISIITSITKALTVPLMFLFVNGPDDMAVCLFIMGGPLFVSGIIGVYLSYRVGIKFNLGFVSFSSIKNTLHSSFPVFIGNVAIGLYTACTPIILSLVSNYNEVGYYTAADKLRAAILGVFLVLGQVIYPRANYLRYHNVNEFGRFIRRLFLCQLFFGTIAALLFYVFMPRLAPFILGSGFDMLDDIVKLMAPMILLIPLSVIMCNCIILPNGNTKAFAFLPIVTAFLHIPYAIYLSHYYGAVGGTISILITEVISFLIIMSYCIKKNYFKLIFK